MRWLARLKLTKPWDWGGLGIVFLALGLSLMTEVSWWRYCEYAAAFCGVMAVIMDHQSA